MTLVLLFIAINWKISFEIVGFHFGAAVVKIFNKCKEIFSWRSFGNPKSVLPSWIFGKKDNPNNINPSSHITRTIQFCNPPPFFLWKFGLKEQA